MSNLSTFGAALSLTAILGALSLSAAWGQEIDIKAATDGRCDYWLPMLRDNPNERVTITLNDREVAEIKVLIDGARWRLVLLSGEDDLAIGCTFAEGEGVIAP